MQAQLTVATSDSRAARAALLLRSSALFGVLFQLTLFAGELSDRPVYIAALLCAMLSAFVLAKRALRAIPAMLIILAVPFIARLLIALPRYFVGDNLTLSIPFDSLLLHYDRNNFVSALPFYYAALSSFFAMRKLSVLRSCVFLDCIVIIIIFSIAKSADIALYSLPFVRISVFALFLLLELSALILSVPKEMLVTKRETIVSFALIFLFVVAGGIFLLFSAQGAASSAGGGGGEGNGLMQAKLFNFDMTPFLQLENEIKMNDELVYIVKRDESETIEELADETHVFMRRFILSQYTSQGSDGAASFTRSETIDEQAQRALIPAGELSLNIPDYKKRETLKQEYYIVNIDGSAFLAMNEAAKIIPYQNYDVSSFKGIYRVDSEVSDANSIDLYISAEKYKNDTGLGLSREEFDWYTDYANAKGGITKSEQKIQELAKSLTADTDNYFEKTLDLVLYLSDGDFRYSLKPGIAPDGDQLSYFLFETKKGYCSYFAFALASMLRSIQIPSRIVVGFFLDPETEKLGFYPILSNMAHAWVEVWFPEYGWIEFDPTTTEMAAGEDWTLSMGVPPDLFEKLMKEIFDNHEKLRAKPPVAEDAKDSFSEIVKQTIAAVQKIGAPLILILIIIFIVIHIYKYRLLAVFSKHPRCKVMFLWKDILFRLRIKGYKQAKDISEGDWIFLLKPVWGELISTLYNNVSQARYAAEYSNDDYDAFIADYSTFSRLWLAVKRLKKMNRPSLIKGKAEPACGGLKKIKTNMKITALIFAAIFFASGDTATSQAPQQDADTLYIEAEKSINAENWERAIQLLNEGREKYPDDYRFPLELGTIYAEREFYNLAKEEFLIVNSLMPDNEYILEKLALVVGSLNDYQAAAAYYEQILALDPENIEVRSELAWMYFKLHRLEEGEAILLTTIAESGSSPRLAMILAIIYSDMLNYEASKQWYADAIATAREFSLYAFASVSYYNYSILESRFYHYQNSFELAENSLAMAERDSGHMAKGELLLRRLEFGRVFAEFENAYQLDKRSPLPKLGLSQAYLVAGRLEEARLYAEDCERITNHAWMINFGIDPAQFKKELNDILYQCYRGLYNQEKLKVEGTIKDTFVAYKNMAHYYFKYQVHKKLYEKWTLESAGSYSIDTMGSQYLDALLNYYSAFGDYPNRAKIYLDKSEQYEAEIIPASRSSYMFERGKLFHDEVLLSNALSAFDTLWERDMIAQTNVELYTIEKNRGQHTLKYTIAEALYLLNPGALRQAGIKLPVQIVINAKNTEYNKKIKKKLLRAGFESPSAKSAFQCRFTLSIDLTESGEARCSLVDRTNGAELVRTRFTLESTTGEALAAFANEVADAVFKTR
ncbi:MAG: tetratricopeptide repeat protein [Spirochaetaceae bacterium]|jgi:tetratricopeptide (TPR) repeat protein|nr:tetratricopeptide repeat protein [Spirochaetaceae bacterium]